MAMFAFVQYIKHAHIVGGWVRKSPEIFFRNILLVPSESLFLKVFNESSMDLI